MTDVANRRARPRLDLRFQVQFAGHRLSGAGVVINISEGGALIGSAEPRVPLGKRIRLRFAFFEDSLPVDIPGKVVRETPEGFAVQFSGLDERLKRLLSVALLKARHRLEKLEAQSGPGAACAVQTSLIR
jgi:hypothetical protein